MTRLAELRRAADCCRDVVAHLGEGVATQVRCWCRDRSLLRRSSERGGLRISGVTICAGGRGFWFRRRGAFLRVVA